MTPALRSFRLTLHPYTRILVSLEHVGWLNDPELMQYSENRHLRHTLMSQYAYVSNFGDNQHLWLIRCGEKDIGTISAHVDDINKRANLGILLGSREHQGQGLAAEAWLAVIDWLFGEGIHKVEAGCRDDNHPMRRLAVTTGMTLEAELPGHFKCGDKWLSAVLYGRFKTDQYHSEWDAMWSEPFYKPGGMA